jgi:hypothetical protein
MNAISETFVVLPSLALGDPGSTIDQSARSAITLWKSVGLFAYLGICLAVAMYGFHRYILVYLYMKHRKDITSPRAGTPTCRGSRSSSDVQRGGRWPSG